MSKNTPKKRAARKTASRKQTRTETPSTDMSDPAENANAMNETKYQHLEGELSEVKEDVAGLKTGMASVNTKLSVLGQGYDNLQKEVTTGFTALSSELRDMKDSPPKLGTQLLISLVGMLALGVGAMWTTIKLLVDPIKESQVTQFQYMRDEIKEHSNLEGHIQAMPRLVRMESQVERNAADIIRSKDELRAENVQMHVLEAERDEALLQQIKTISTSVGVLQQKAEDYAEEKGRQQIYDEWHSTWLVFLEKQMDAVRAKSDGAGDRASALKAQLDALEKKVRRVDEGGSVKWLKKLPAAGE